MLVPLWRYLTLSPELSEISITSRGPPDGRDSVRWGEARFGHVDGQVKPFEGEAGRVEATDSGLDDLEPVIRKRIDCVGIRSS